MFKRRSEADPACIETLIGRHVSVQGDIRFSGGLHIDGHVAGSVCASAEAGEREASLSISEHGRVQGSVAATHLVLNGRVEVDVLGSERVVLGSKADVRGDVEYRIIEMALGARIRGRLIPRGVAVAPAEPGPAAAPEGVRAGVFDAPKAAP
jgi:cytoskeletal protein CcmA (bactofilin family)